LSPYKIWQFWVPESYKVYMESSPTIVHPNLDERKSFLQSDQIGSRYFSNEHGFSDLIVARISKTWHFSCIHIPPKQTIPSLYIRNGRYPFSPRIRNGRSLFSSRIFKTGMDGTVSIGKTGTGTTVSRFWYTLRIVFECVQVDFQCIIYCISSIRNAPVSQLRTD